MDNENSRDTEVQTGSPAAGSEHFFVKFRPLVGAVLALMSFVAMAGFLLMLPAARSGRVDFRTFYTAGYMVRTGHGSALHDYPQTLKFQYEVVSPAPFALPVFHWAYGGLLYGPFSFFNYRKAYLAFLLCNIVCLILTVKMMGPGLQTLTKSWSLLPIALPVCFLPVTMVLIEGQDSLLLLALLVAAWVAAERQSDFQSGALVGLSLFKFQYALPIALLFFLWRRWRFIGGFLVSAAAVAALSVSVLGISGVTEFVHFLLGTSVKFSAANDVLLGIHPDGMANLRGLVYVLSGRAAGYTNVVTIVISVVALGWAASWRPTFPGSVLAALLVSYHQMISDTSLLILPLSCLMAQLVKEKRRGQALNLGWIVSILAFIGPSLLLFAGTRFYLEAIPIMTLFVIFPRFIKWSPKESCRE